MAMVQSPKAATSSSPSLILTSGASGRIRALFSVQALKSLVMLINAFFLLLLIPFRGRRRTVVSAGVSARGSSSSSSSSSFCDQKSKDDRLLQEIGVHRTKLRVPATIVPWKSGGGSAVTAVVDSEVGGRRAIAIKRALQEDDPNTAREFSLFVSARGDTIFTQSWTSVSVKIRGLVVLMHGLNEHRFVICAYCSI
ncbi:monoglyceride lipase [Salix suchowensis]|nr:monoglyceride lipase [Salix suchowensis]